DRVDQREGRAAVAVVVRRLGDDAEVELPSLFGGLRGGDTRSDGQGGNCCRRRSEYRSLHDGSLGLQVNPTRFMSGVNAGHRMSGGQFAHWWHSFAAFLGRQRATGMKDASFGKKKKARKPALDDPAHSFILYAVFG